MTRRLDVKKLERDLYTARPDAVDIVDVPDAQYVMLDGTGGPSSGDFDDAVHAILGVGHALRARLREHEAPSDYVLPPLEAQWWWDERGKTWRWTLLLRNVVEVGDELFREALREAAWRAPSACLDRVRLGVLHEGRAAQTLHLGPYDRERETLARLHDAMRHEGLVAAGKHHEVYLADPRRVPPERLRTLVRQPVRWSDEG